MTVRCSGDVGQRLGLYARALDYYERTLALSRAAADPSYESLASIYLGQLRRYEGDFTEALRLELDGVRLARDGNLVVPLMCGLFLLALTRTDAGLYDEALATL